LIFTAESIRVGLRRVSSCGVGARRANRPSVSLHRAGLHRAGLLMGAIAALAGWGSGVAPAALAGSAHIYWSNDYSTTIGRANPEGGEINDELITGASGPEGLAVVGQYVYWANEGSSTIGRANLEGGEVNQAFIKGADNPSGLAAYDGRLYWANLPDGTIGDANLEGGEVNQALISGASDPGGVAAGGGYVYWSNLKSGSIGRASLQGAEVDQEFIKVGGEPDGLAVNGQHIYWSNFAAGTIGRANLQGGEIDQELIKGAIGPDGVALDAHNIYWTNLQGDTIGRANLEGGEVDQEFIKGAIGPGGLALAPSTPAAAIAPAAGGVYSLNELVPTAFLCSEGLLQPETGLSSCDDSNATDSVGGGYGHLSTSTLGPHTYAVSAAASDGLVGTASIAYTVAAPPTATIAAPASGKTFTQGEAVTTTFACTEGSYGPGLAACEDSNSTATAAGGRSHLSTAAVGAHTYTVTAVSKDGQAASTTIRYTVVVAAKTTIKTSRARVKGTGVEVRLACSTAVHHSCSGTLSLTITRKRRVQRRVHGRLRTVTVSTSVVLAHSAYSVSNGKQRTVVLRLDKTGLEMLERASGGVLRAQARATVAGGHSTSRSVSLER
jgi:virginiamycin B lyase